MGRTTGSGECQLCGHQAGESELLHHLVACASNHDAQGPTESLIQLRFAAVGDRRYWLHLEARAQTTLERVDSLLRHVWLECCGHLSAFRIGRDELGMGRKVGKTFSRKGLSFDYEYDFGSTTALKGKVTGTREGCLGRPAVRLLAQNDPLRWSCAECAAAATVICPFCLYEGRCLFCEEHAARHEHVDEEAYLPVVNSPRMGVCGYTG